MHGSHTHEASKMTHFVPKILSGTKWTGDKICLLNMFSVRMENLPAYRLT
jgi:hypothetical protein